MVKKSYEKLKRARNDQNQHRSSKEQEKLKINTPLKLTPPNTLNASSPP
jgi:hypothetical protein